MSTSPILIWLRRDLRLTDHAAFHAAARSGRPVIPVFIHDKAVEALGAAPKWRLGLGLGHFGNTLAERGSRLVLRRGDPLDVLKELVEETGAGAVYWLRLYDPDAVARDSEIKSKLKTMGIDARSFGGHLMFEPWTVKTKTGGFYKVYTPFWNMVKTRDVEAPLPAPQRLATPGVWPVSEDLSSWSMGAQMKRGASVVRPYVRLGEGAAQARLSDFIDAIIERYNTTRDQPGADGTSGLSENLSLGEISPHQCWHAGHRALQEGKTGAETFLKELVWREFAYHLMHHTPHILTGNWKADWDSFPWSTDETADRVVAWKQGRTGIRFVDAAMREMYVTGRMHNRGRMIVASYLTKHLLSHWKIGLRWFEACLIDWDPASNAMGWQWSAGSGPDATPYFRVFNPVTQLDKFDSERFYAKRWIAEGCAQPSATAVSYFDAIPKSWNLSADDAYPVPVVPADTGRKIALEAYENKSF
ncbi:MAG: deoxyribodipyrimidine photo-lyase [Pseudomonadota bacterium]